MSEPEVVAPETTGEEQRRLRRPVEGRMVAGVAAGVAEHLRIDATLVRILFVVGALFNLLGVIVYAVLWVLVPSDAEAGADRGAARSPGEGRSTGFWVGVGLVAVGAMWLLPWGALGRLGVGEGLLLPLVLIGGGLALWLSDDRRRTRGDAPPAWQASSPPSSATAPSAATPPAGATVAETGGLPARPPMRDGPAGTGGAPPPPPVRDDTGGTGGAPPPPPARERSPLVRVTLGAALVVAGAAWLAGVAGLAGVHLELVLGLALAVIAAGLLVGAWWGRGRVLILAGVPLSLVLLALVAAPVVVPPVPLSGTVGQANLVVEDIDALEANYEHVAGSIRLDLRGLELDGDAATRVAVGAGEVEVLLPDDVPVDVDAAASVGELSVLGVRRAGVGPSLTLADGDGDARLSLEVRVGAGEVRISRDANERSGSPWAPARSAPSDTEPAQEVDR